MRTVGAGGKVRCCPCPRSFEPFTVKSSRKENGLPIGRAGDNLNAMSLYEAIKKGIEACDGIAAALDNEPEMQKEWHEASAEMQRILDRHDQKSARLTLDNIESKVTDASKFGPTLRID